MYHEFRRMPLDSRSFLVLTVIFKDCKGKLKLEFCTSSNYIIVHIYLNFSICINNTRDKLTMKNSYLKLLVHVKIKYILLMYKISMYELWNNIYTIVDA